jgi:ArsR family transcriptional regulator
MRLVEIYQAFSDPTRLRIVHLLTRGPLCVCHFQEVLNEPQVKISKHLAYLRARGLVDTERDGNFIIYRLPTRKDATLTRQLACLAECVGSDAALQADFRRLNVLRESCCKSAVDLPRDRRTLLAATQQ